MRSWVLSPSAFSSLSIWTLSGPRRVGTERFDLMRGCIKESPRRRILGTYWKTSFQILLRTSVASGSSLVVQLVKNLLPMQETACNAEDLSSIPGEGNGKPLQYPYLGNPMDRRAWWAIVPGVARVGHNLVTKPPPPIYLQLLLNQLRGSIG